MIKDDIIKKLSVRTGFSNNFSKKLTKDFFNAVTKNIKNNKFIFKNIGSFKLIDKKERLGRNPKTKEEYIINKRKSISFIAAKKILDFLNQN